MRKLVAIILIVAVATTSPAIAASASKEENVGVSSGVVIGALAGGPGRCDYWRGDRCEGRRFDAQEEQHDRRPVGIASRVPQRSCQSRERYRRAKRRTCPFRTN